MKRKLAAVLLALCMVLALAPADAFAAGTTTFTGVDKVMIYNPLVTISSANALSTGDMSGQIRITAGTNSLSTADYGGGPYIQDIPQDFWDDLGEYDPDAVVDETAPLDNFVTYDTGTPSTASFFINPSGGGGISSYSAAQFNCLYDGTHCIVWGYGYNNSTEAAAMGREFDNKIYGADTTNFGTARYMENGGKLNILVYSMNNNNLCGFFVGTELYTEAEMSNFSDGSNYIGHFNLGKPIIHINSYWCDGSSWRKSQRDGTLAHEYQHLICASSSIFNSNIKFKQNLWMKSWLNEVMSKEAEELIYPGVVQSNNYITGGSGSYNNSNQMANGQSLYDFDTTNDIGAYGRGFLFSEYLKKQAGDDSTVFKRIHDKWRIANTGELTEGIILRYALPAQKVAAIEKTVAYPSTITTSLGTANIGDQFMSKLNLTFQIATVVKATSGLYAMTDQCYNADPKTYGGATSTTIPAGGRIYVETADGNSYTVPAGADSKLIYVGFKNNKMVIAPTTASEYVPGSYSVGYEGRIVADSGSALNLCVTAPAAATNVSLVVAVHDGATDRFISASVRNNCSISQGTEVTNIYSVIAPDPGTHTNLKYKVYIIDGASYAPLGKVKVMALSS